MPDYDDESYRDDRDRDEPSREDRDEIIAKAKSKTSTVSTFLIITGILSLLLVFGGIYLNFVAKFDFNVWMFELGRDNAKDQRTKDEFAKRLEEHNNRPEELKNAEKIFQVVGNSFGLIGMLLYISAGFMMKSLKGYMLCMIGAIFGILCSGCCFITAPFSIWAIIVLVNKDVKAGFDAVKKMG